MHEINLITIKISNVVESQEQSERLVLAPRCFRHRLGCDKRTAYDNDNRDVDVNGGRSGGGDEI